MSARLWSPRTSFVILDDTAEAVNHSVGAAAEPPRDELSVARDVVALYRHLSGMAAQTAELSAVTDLLAERLDAPVWVVSEGFTAIVASGPELSPREAMERVRKHAPHVRWDRILRVAAETGSAIRSPETKDGSTIIVAPVFVHYEVAAYLMTVVGKLSGRGDFALLATEHGATVCGVMLSRERVLASASTRAREDLIEGLLVGRASDTAELDRWARHLGFDATVPHRVMILVSQPMDSQERNLGSDRRARIGEVIKHFCESRSVGALAVVRDVEVVVLAPEEPAQGSAAGQLGRECLSYCSDVFPTVRVAAGLSRLCREAADIARAYGEARRTASAATRLGRYGEVVTFENLGIHRLLLQLPDLGELRAFVDDVLGPLRRYDKQHGSQLIETLAACFREGPSPRRMADRLHVHPNTVTYRLKRIAEVGRLDLDRYEDRLMAQVALEASVILREADE